MRSEPSNQPALSHQPPSIDVVHGFATSNSTSNHFLGTSQRPWMTGASSTAPHTPRPKVNMSVDASHSRSTRVQKEGEVNTTQGSDSRGNAFTPSGPSTSSPRNPQNGAAAATIPTNSANSTQPQQENRTPKADRTSLNTSDGVHGADLETPTQLGSAATPPVTIEPPPPALAATARLSSRTDLPTVQTTPQADWHRWQAAETLRFSAGPSTSPTATSVSSNVQPPPALVQTPIISPVSVQAPGTASRKRPNEAQDEGRRIRSRSDGPIVSQIPTPSATPTVPSNPPYLGQLLESIARLREQQLLNMVDEQRLSLLREACRCNDTVYIMLHQVYCIAFSNRTLLVGLSFTDAEFAGLNVLEPILVHNSCLTKGTLSLCTNFPRQPYSLFEPASAQTLGKVRVSLTALGNRCESLRNTCKTRGYPPSTIELAFAFSLQSPTMQKTLYNSIHRQVSGIDNPDFTRRAIKLFLDDQRKFAQSRVGLSHNLVLQDGQRFGQKYLQLRMAAGVFPAQYSVNQQRRPSAHSPANANFAQIPPQATVQQAAPFVPYQPVQQHHSQNGQQGAFMHATTAHPQTPASAAIHYRFLNHVAPNGTYPQQHAGGSSRATVPTPRPMAQSRDSNNQRHASFVNGTQPVTVEHHLLPLPGYPVPFTTNPNPDRVALHQAHLRSPTPRKLDVKGKDVPDLRLYQYVQDFVLEPQKVEPSTKFVEWHFNINQAAFVRKALDLPSIRIYVQ